MRSNKRPNCKSCDDSSMNSQPSIRPESRQLHSQVHWASSEQVNKVPTELRVWMLTKSDLRDRSALSVSTFVLGRMKETAGTGNSWNTSLKDLWSKLLSRVSQLDVAGVHRSMSDVSLTVVWTRIHGAGTTKRWWRSITSSRWIGLMQPTWREKDPSSQGPHNDGACGEATRGRCVSGENVQRRQTPLVPQRPVNQSNSAELVEKCPPTTRHKVKRKQWRLQKSRVRSCRRATNNSREEVGLISHAALDGRAGPRCTIARTTWETLVWKPLETRPHHVSGARGDSGANVSHRQCRHGWTQTKNSQGRDPRTQESKRAQPTAGEKSIPNSRERTGATGEQTQCNWEDRGDSKCGGMKCSQPLRAVQRQWQSHRFKSWFEWWTFLCETTKTNDPEGADEPHRLDGRLSTCPVHPRA